MTKVIKTHIVRCLGGKELPKYSGRAFLENFLQEVEAHWKDEKERRGMLSYILLSIVEKWWDTH